MGKNLRHQSGDPESKGAVELLAPELSRVASEAGAALAEMPQVIDFLRDQLSRIPLVREAYVSPSPRGLHLWAVVDEPFLEGESEVLDKIDETMERHRNLPIIFLVIPSDSASSTQWHDGAIPVVQR